jgi:glycosyltransferase involved in cell wall biosynthesis
MVSPPTRTRILHGLGALVAGGAERACVDLALAQKRAGLDVAICCLSPRIDAAGEYWRNLLAAQSVPVIAGPTDRVGWSSVWWLRKQLVKPDLAIFHIHLDNVVLAYHLARKLHRRRYGVLRKLANMHVSSHLRLRWALNRCDIRHLVAGGKSTAEHLRGRFRGELYCIPNGMNFHWPIQTPEHKATAQATLGLDPGLRHWVMAGRMSGDTPATAQKAHDTLIQAWRQASAGAAGGRLHLLGDGNLRPALEAMAGGDPSIIFHGVVAGVERWLLACDGFILCTRWEGLPNAAIEAAGTGVPMILSDIPPCREIGARQTTFVPADNRDAWADALRVNVSDETRVGTTEGMPAVRQRYGIERVVSEYAAVYRDIWPGQPPEEVSAPCKC